MLLRKLCQQLRNARLRQCSTRPILQEQIPKPKILIACTEVWQKRHMKELKKLIVARRISDATTYFYNEIKTPNLNLFSVMLAAVGRTGHTELAFKLFRDMRARDIRPTPAILTSLFNSCANNREDSQRALAKANDLYEQMALKGWHGTQITYHSMMKAFAMHGDITTCFKLIDEMVADRVAIDADTYNHLMMACVGDKETGFVLAIRVMRMILWNRIRPSVACYTNFIRAAAECGCGSNIDVLNKLLSDARKTQLKDPRVPQIEAGTNLLDTRLSEDLISVAAVPKDVNERLALIGGVQGLLKQMDYFNLKPTASTYSVVLRCITNERDLLEFIKLIPLEKMDIGFWNQLLKKCVVEKYECAAYIQKKLYRSGLEFDILTYGILAMRVDSPEALNKYMTRMNDKDIVPNVIIMSTLINNIGRSFRFNSLLKLLTYCKDNEIPINKSAAKNLAAMLNANKHAKVNALILGILKKLVVAKDETTLRTRQFDPAVRKRNKRKWDPDADDEDIEEVDRVLQEEAKRKGDLTEKLSISVRKKTATPI